jgi:uncharacterized membrane protein
MQRDGLLSLAIAIMMSGVAYFSSHVFQGRAAFLLTGAVMATCMSANVFFWIIPGQRRMVKALNSGEPPNPLDGKRKTTIRTNTYFTLPVVFLMISNHYAFSYSNEASWFIMTLFILAGALIRQYFVLRHQGQNMLTLPAASGILLLVIGMIAAPTDTKAVPEEIKSSNYNDNKSLPSTSNDIHNISHILQERCASCHAARPTQVGFSAAPAGILLDNDQDIQTSRQNKTSSCSVNTCHWPI